MSDSEPRIARRAKGAARPNFLKKAIHLFRRYLQLIHYQNLGELRLYKILLFRCRFWENVGYSL